jgi:hypothetical protein
MPPMHATFRIGLAVALVLLTVHPAGAAQTYCEPRVSERLDRLDVDPSDIRSIFYDLQRRSGRDNDRVVRILAWVSLHSCKGYVIVDLSPHCTIREVYGRGDCTLGGTVKPW